MNDSTAIIADEAREIELDFRYIHKTTQHGDITSMLTWDWGGDQPEPCLLLAPTYWDRNDGDPTLCVIRMNDAWKWSRTHNNDRWMIGSKFFGKPPSSDNWQMATGIYYAERLGLNGSDTRTVNRIRGIIEDSLDYLVMLPPAPEREGMGEAVFELTRISTGKTREITIKGT